MDFVEIFGLIVGLLLLAIAFGIAVCWSLHNRNLRQKEDSSAEISGLTLKSRTLANENFREPTRQRLLPDFIAEKDNENKKGVCDQSKTNNSMPPTDSTELIHTSDGVAYDAATERSHGEYANSRVSSEENRSDLDAEVEPQDNPQIYPVACNPDVTSEIAAIENESTNSNDLKGDGAVVRSNRANSKSSLQSTGSAPPTYERPPEFASTSANLSSPSDVSLSSVDMNKEAGSVIGSGGNAMPASTEVANATTKDDSSSSLSDDDDDDDDDLVDHRFHRGAQLSPISESPELLLKLQPSIRLGPRTSRRRVSIRPVSEVWPTMPDLGEPPMSLPPLPHWMQPEAYNPWVTIRRRPLYRTVVVQRNTSGDLGFGLGIKAGSEPVVRRTTAPWLSDTVLDGDEILGVKGTAATNENVAELFSTAGVTGAAFSVDVIRYINDTETRSTPKPASDGDRARIPAEVASRLEINEDMACALIDEVGESLTLQAAALSDHRLRLQLAAPLLKGGSSREEFIKTTNKTPARHRAIANHDGPLNRQLLRFPAGSLIVVYDKRPAGWWGGTANGNSGWFPAHFVSSDPHESTSTAGELEEIDGATDGSTFIESSANDALFAVPGWWEPGKYVDPLTIPWDTLLPHRAKVNVCTRTQDSNLDNISDTPPTSRYTLEFTDGSYGEVAVVFEPGYPRPTITEEWLPASAKDSVKPAEASDSLGAAVSTPRLRGTKSLRNFATRFGPKLVQFCAQRATDGTIVGDGSAWALLNAALAAVRARPPSNDFVFGQAITEIEVSDGDVIVFADCYFSGSEGDGVGTHYTLHAAVVKAREGRVMSVWEAGADGGSTPVHEGEYNMMKLQKGTVTYYRPLPAFDSIRAKHRHS